MKLRHHRWLITALAALIAGSLVGGCDDDSGWEHPNRELYPAPPEQQSDAMSVEELQRTWKEQDQTAARVGPSDGQAATSDVFDLVLEYVQEALGAVVSNTEAGSANQAREQPKALGGGPLSGEPPPEDDGAGEM